MISLPFKIRREALMDAEELAAVATGLMEGKTPQELAMNGLTAAIDPKVLQ